MNDSDFIKECKERIKFKEQRFFLCLILLLLFFIGLMCSCTTPSITIYQQGESVGNGTIVVRETKHLQQVETIYKGKGKVGKVIVRRELE